MRHDGRTQDAGGEQHAVGALEARHEAAERVAGLRAGVEDLVDEAEQDHAEQAGDHGLEAAFGEFFDRRGCVAMTQQALRRHKHQRLAPLA